MKLLVVLSRFPYPLEKGDKLRAYHQLRVLSQQHEIYLFALSDKEVSAESMEALTPFCKEIRVGKLTLFTKLWNSFGAMFKACPIQCGYFYSKRVFCDNLRLRLNPMPFMPKW